VEFKAIVRIVDKDVKGEVPISHAITLAKGASFMMANAVCKVLKLDEKKRAGDISPAEMEKIEECLRNPTKFGIPKWICNRRKDRETGETKHIVSSDLDLTHKFDIRRLKKIRTYRGARHAKNLAVRGQRTRTTHRKGGPTLGVIRKNKSSGKK